MLSSDSNSDSSPLSVGSKCNSKLKPGKKKVKGAVQNTSQLNLTTSSNIPVSVQEEADIMETITKELI